jgi:hypothetical protein
MRTPLPHGFNGLAYATIVAFTLSFVGVVIGLLYTHFSKKHEFLKERLEKVQFLILEYQNLMSVANSGLLTEENGIPVFHLRDKRLEIYMKLEVLLNLYFPELLRMNYEIYNTTADVATALETDYVNMKDFEVAMKIAVHDAHESINHCLSYMRNNQDCLTQAVFPWLWARIQRTLNWA